MPKKRKQKQIQTKKSLRIYCEGAKTEPTYIGHYVDKIEDREKAGRVKCVKTDKNTPVQLVEAAVADKRSPSFVPGDELWVVYDRESVSKYSDELHSQAYDQAMANGIKLAVTNVCFEYWLILHNRYTTAGYTCYDDLYRRSDLRNDIRIIYGVEYDKAASALFLRMIERVGDARVRAERVNNESTVMFASGEPVPYRNNPYIGFVKLIDAIDAFS